MSISTSNVYDNSTTKIIDDLDGSNPTQISIKKEQAMPMVIVEEKNKSLRIGVIGTGQAGSRLAESFAKLGYDAIAFNTASQDLKFIDLPEENKFEDAPV